MCKTTMADLQRIEKPVFPHDFLASVCDGAQGALYDWLKVNAPEEVTGLFDKYVVLRDSIQDAAEGTTTRMVNENTVDNVSAVTHILADMGRPFYSQYEGNEIPPHAAWLEAHKVEVTA